jgi:hypothetical protein
MGSARASRLAVPSRCGLGEFRHSGRQLEYVVHDQGSSVSLQTNPVLRPAMASTGEADCSHAGELEHLVAYAGSAAIGMAGYGPSRGGVRVIGDRRGV